MSEEKLNPLEELGEGYSGYWFKFFRRIKCYHCGKELNGYISDGKGVVQCFECAIPSKRFGEE